jgi:hypothetical protein
MNNSHCGNTTIENTIYYKYKCEHSLTLKIINDYLYLIVQISCLIHVVICLLIFRKILKHEHQNTRNGNIFNYLFLKLIFDFLSIITDMSENISSSKSLKYSYISQIIYIWIYYYSNSVLVIISTYIEVLVTFDCYLVINNFLNFFKSKKSFYINITVLVVVSICINIIYLFSFDVIEIEGDFFNHTTKYDNTNFYGTIYSCFYLTKYFTIISNIILILRDFLPNIFLFIINFLIVLTLKRIRDQKKALHVNDSEV